MSLTKERIEAIKHGTGSMCAEMWPVELRELCDMALRLRGFAERIMRNWPESDVDGGELQDAAEKFGLLEPREVTESCGETCSCAEYGDFPMTCYRRTALIAEAK